MAMAVLKDQQLRMINVADGPVRPGRRHRHRPGPPARRRRRPRRQALRRRRRRPGPHLHRRPRPVTRDPLHWQRPSLALERGSDVRSSTPGGRRVHRRADDRRRRRSVRWRSVEDALAPRVWRGGGPCRRCSPTGCWPRSCSPSASSRSPSTTAATSGGPWRTALLVGDVGRHRVPPALPDRRVDRLGRAGDDLRRRRRSPTRRCRTPR